MLLSAGRLQEASADLEDALALPLPARCFLAALHVEFLLPLGNIGQDRPEPLVLGNRRLVDLAQLVVNPVG